MNCTNIRISTIIVNVCVGVVHNYGFIYGDFLN